MPLPVPLLPEVIVTQGQLLTAVQLHPVGAVTLMEPVPPLGGKVCPTGEMVVGFVTVVVAVAVLFAEFGSKVVEPTVAVLLMVEPLTMEQLGLATRVMTADAPDASELKLTVRLLPEPPQTPPPVATQELNDTVEGRLSVTKTELAASGPMLVTVIV